MWYFAWSKQKELAWDLKFPKPPMLSVLSVKTKWLLKQETQHKVMNREGKDGRGERI